MRERQLETPPYLQWPENIKLPTDVGLLERSITEMFTALSHFHNHVKHVIYIMVSIPAIVLVIIRIWPSENYNPVLYFIGGIMLLFVPFIGKYSIQVIEKYYRVYVSSLAFAVRVYQASNIEQVHPWLERTIIQANDMQHVSDVQHFITQRVNTEDDSFRIYRKIIIVLSILTTMCGVPLILFFILSLFPDQPWIQSIMPWIQGIIR